MPYSRNDNRRKISAPPRQSVFQKRDNDKIVNATPKIGVHSNMYRHSGALPKPPRQVAPSPPRYACHLSRFNGRAYSRKGNFPRSVCSPRLCETPCGSWQSRRLEYARLCKPLRPLLRGLLRCTRNDVPTLAFPCREGGGEADG